MEKLDQDDEQVSVGIDTGIENPTDEDFVTISDNRFIVQKPYRPLVRIGHIGASYGHAHVQKDKKYF